MKEGGSPHSISKQPESHAEKPAAPKIISTVGKQSPESPEKDSDSDPASNPPPLPNGKSNAAGLTPDDALSLHSMANDGHDMKSDQKSESSVLSSGGESESVPPGEMKSEPSPSAIKDVSSEKQAPETDKPDPLRESSGSTETPLPDEATNERVNPSSSTREETEASEQGSKLEETEPESTPGAQEDSGTQVSGREAEQLAVEKQQPSISSGIEEQIEERGHAAELAQVMVPPGKTTDPAEKNSALLTSLPAAKKPSMVRSFTGRLKDDDLKAMVVIPSYLSKGMVAAIESAGVAYSDGPRIKNVRAPENPLLVFINSKSGGRLGPALEALLVDLIAPTQVYDLSKCKPADVLRYGLGHLEQEADAGDKTALETRNNLRIMVAGGDGTVGWVLGSIGELGQNERFKVPPVGVLPLGTGNDLSRSFKWGGSTTSISRTAMKRWLKRCADAEIAKLDSWQLVVKPAPTRQDAELTLPHAMHPHQHIPLEKDESSKDETKISPYFEGSFWNYFSLGMDAQVAYGFHHLRHEAPWLASGPISNQMVYGGYSCVQGWFCAPCATAPVLRGLRQIVKVYIKRVHDVDAQWVELELPANIRAIVILNLQSYAGGRNPWGRPSINRREKEGYVEARCDDGVLEIVGLRDGWHTAFVLLDWFTAIRLGQATGVKLELKGKAHRRKAYMQIDGEPWQQPLGEDSDPPAVIEISYCPVHSICLLRK